jgi:hypothetical protein
VSSIVFTESLTVRILGDSSGLQQELETVAHALDRLQQQISEASDAGRQIGEGLGQAATAMGPLTRVSTMLQQISQQARALGQQPITLNVQPAMAALAQLSAMIQMVAALLQGLGGGFGVFGGGGFGAGGGRPVRMPAPAFANGGLVEGPAGTDQVPAWLTAGEFVMSRESTRRIGTTFLTALNSPRPLAARPPIVNSDPAHVTNETNHFGGITIQVREAVEINDVIRDLRFQGAAIRNRRG